MWFVVMLLPDFLFSFGKFLFSFFKILFLFLPYYFFCDDEVCHFRPLNVKVRRKCKQKVWELTSIPLTSSVCSYLVYIYSELTSKCIINAFGAFLFLKQCRPKLTVVSQFVHMWTQRDIRISQQNTVKTCRNAGVKNSLSLNTIYILSFFLSKYAVEHHL